MEMLTGVLVVLFVVVLGVLFYVCWAHCQGRAVVDQSELPPTPPDPEVAAAVTGSPPQRAQLGSEYRTPTRGDISIDESSFVSTGGGTTPATVPQAAQQYAGPVPPRLRLGSKLGKPTSSVSFSPGSFSDVPSTGRSTARSKGLGGKIYDALGYFNTPRFLFETPRTTAEQEKEIPLARNQNASISKPGAAVSPPVRTPSVRESPFRSPEQREDVTV
eukprot:Hpha_TRINITY_DN17875_c0_g1::TRINITY_DN17875_c0_g1_i1::g.177561::m.177561